jgi:hypothetical protein
MRRADTSSELRDVPAMIDYLSAVFRNYGDVLEAQLFGPLTPGLTYLPSPLLVISCTPSQNDLVVGVR